MMTENNITRRGFLKIGCAGAAAVGLTVCGVTAFAPNRPPIELEEYTYRGEKMNRRILVAYATYAGSTVDVACTIGETIASSGISVEVKPIVEIHDISDYDAVMIGSAVQHAKWLPEAIGFVKTHQAALSRVPVALFCVHIQNTGDDETSRKNRLAYLDEARQFVTPAAEGYFTGKFDRRGAELLLPGLVARFVPPIDMRKWDVIRRWAENVHPVLVTT